MGSRPHARRLALAGVLLLLTATSPTAPLPASPARGVAAAEASPGARAAAGPEQATVTRVAGRDRFDTARRSAERTFPAGAHTVVLASGAHFADALTSAYVAGQRAAPVLLTHRDEIPAATRAGLATLEPSTVVLLGGPAAIGPAVAAELEASGHDVERIGGADRYETARLAAESGERIGTLPGDGAVPARERAVVLASGEAFADALAAGPLAYAGALPILLTPAAALSSHARAVLADETLGIERVLVAGGTRAVSSAVEDEVAALGKTVVRVAGSERTATAARLAERTAAALGWALDEVHLVSGAGFADALAVAPLAGTRASVLVLSASAANVGGPTAAVLAAHCEEVASIVVAGGTAAVSDTAAGEAARAATCRVATTLTLAPADAEAPVGTTHTVVATLRDQFGEPVPGAVVRFEVYRDGGGLPVGEAVRATTDEEGRAAFAYEGTTVATDRIVARR